MILKECKRLAEVDFPIAEVSRHAAREKSIRHGHPSTLHLWWARRPLASCRAVLLALLWPDPCDPNCPESFKAEARRQLGKVPRCNPGKTNEDLRQALLRFIADFANWDLAANPTYLEVARALVKAAYPDEPPLVVDPFAGGGSIPLEALRVGCEAFASDLNPVACLILKVMLEDIPRHGPKLAEELRRVGAEIKKEAGKELAELYPRDPDLPAPRPARQAGGSTPIAYLWERTVRCESPGCGAEIPLVRSFWLCKKANRKRALRYRVERPQGKPSEVVFEIFEPKNEREVPGGTVTRAKATCLCCGSVLPPERVRSQLAEQRGGADVVFDDKGQRIGGARLLAVVTLKPGETGRHYRLPTERDYEAVRKAQARLKAILEEWKRDVGAHGHAPLPCPVPHEPLPPVGTLGFRVQRYGMLQWGDLFTARQKVALVTLVRLTAETQRTQRKDQIGEAVRLLLAIAIDKTADLGNGLAPWKPDAECPVHLFARQALPMAWDFAESTPASDASGSFESAFGRTADGLASFADRLFRPSQVQQADATEHPLPDETAQVWFTDPPYYDAIDYAHCSDFFFVWLKRALPEHPLLRDPFDPPNPLTPKTGEIVVDSTTTKGHGIRTPSFYNDSMAKAFAEGRRVLREDGVGAVVFAHKTTEGWEALLSGLIRGGLTITGSWPIATEMASRLRARESAALATSVHLVCRPRPDDAPVGDWAEVLRELPTRVGDWMERLQAEGVRGADLVFACIGPALEIFSRYSRVETAEGREVWLAEFLEKVWEVVGRAALEQVLGTAEARASNAAAGAVEEDARLTALFLWTLQSTNGEAEGAGPEESEEDVSAEDEDEEETSSKKVKGYRLVFDVVRRFAQPLGIDLPRWEGRVIETDKGVVRLYSIAERARILFGKEGAEAVVQRLEKSPAGARQLGLFDEKPKSQRRGRGRNQPGVKAPEEAIETARAATTLDGSTWPCCSRPAARPTPCASSSRPSRNADRISCALPTPSPPCIRRAARRSVSSMRCCWPCRVNV